MRFRGENLKQAREARKMSMTDLSDMIKINPGYISQLETNKKNPRPEMVAKLSQALGIDELFFYLEESRLPQDVLPNLRNF